MTRSHSITGVAAERAESAGPLLVLGPRSARRPPPCGRRVRGPARRALSRGRAGTCPARPQPAPVGGWLLDGRARRRRDGIRRTSADRPRRAGWPAVLRGRLGRRRGRAAAAARRARPDRSPPCCSAPAPRSATPTAGGERAAQVRRVGHAGHGRRSAERWFGRGLPEREPQVAAALLQSLRDADARGYAQVCEALAELRRPRPARRDRRAGTGRRRGRGRRHPAGAARRDRDRRPARRTA